jgi:hypothetical protein
MKAKIPRYSVEVLGRRRVKFQKTKAKLRRPSKARNPPKNQPKKENQRRKKILDKVAKAILAKVAVVE